MKIRNGFVSNSSSSSFLIFGKRFEDVNSFNNPMVKEMLEEDLDLYEIMETFFPNNKVIDYYLMEYEDAVYVGQSWSKVKDDETGLQFKERTVKEMNEILGTNYTVSNLTTLEEAWHG